MFNLFKQASNMDVLSALAHSKACEYLVDFYEYKDKQENLDLYIEALIYNSEQFWKCVGKPRKVTRDQVLLDIYNHKRGKK